jgi:nucleotide-binding universal stress UspA family protein
MMTILAPIDLSPISAEVVAHAADLAHAFRGRVVLVTVMVEPIFVKEYAPPPELLRRVTVGNEKAVQRRLAELEKQLARHSTRSTSVILRGSPTRLILEQARKTRADYIVIGSHGHSAFFDLIGGSTMHGVLKHARCPVVIVPAHAKHTPLRSP